MKIISVIWDVLLFAVLVSSVGWYFYSSHNADLLVPNDLPDLRPLLEEKQFARLTEELEGYQNDYEQDYAKEDYLVETIEKFVLEYDYNETADLLEQWEYASEGSHMPYAVQCFFFSKEAFSRRGEDLLANTPRENINQMRKFTDLSDKKCEFGLSMNPKSSVAYSSMIKNAMLVSDRARKNDVLRRAREHLVDSYAVDGSFLWSIQPQWGGSIEEMKEFVEHRARTQPSEVFTRRLRGRIWYSKGWNDYSDDRLHTALKYINEAVDLYPARSHLQLRARVHRELGDYEASNSDLKQILKRFPDVPYENELLARNYRSLGQYDKAIQLYDELVARHEDNARYYSNRGYTLWDARKHDKAEADLFKAIELDPDNHRYWAQLGRLYVYRLKEPDKAEAAFNTAIDLDPAYPMPYYEAGLMFYYAADGRANQYLENYLAMCEWSKECEKEQILFAEEFFRCLEPNSGCSWDEVDKKHFM